MSDSSRAKDSKAYRRTLLWVFALATLVRLVYAGEHSRSPFFGVPILDEKYYDTVAQAMVEGKDFSRINPGFRPLLYPAFVAAGYRLSSDGGLVITTWLQHLLGVLTAVLVAALAMRLYRRASAAAASAAPTVPRTGTRPARAAPPMR